MGIYIFDQSAVAALVALESRNMNIAAALEMIAQAKQLQDVTAKASDADGRWELLQAWLKQNPKWKKTVEAFAVTTPDEAYGLLKLYICEVADVNISTLSLFVNGEIEQKAKDSIAVIQACYRERAELKPKKGRLKSGA
jgi:hypothetical protein